MLPVVQPAKSRGEAGQSGDLPPAKQKKREALPGGGVGGKGGAGDKASPLGAPVIPGLCSMPEPPQERWAKFKAVRWQLLSLGTWMSACGHRVKLDHFASEAGVAVELLCWERQHWFRPGRWVPVCKIWHIWSGREHRVAELLSDV
jgi:hypothetical protein